MRADGDETFQLKPVGYVRSPFRERSEAPRQARAARDTEGRVELLPGRHFEDAVADLQDWEYLWLLTFFAGNTHWRPKVRPPRSDKKRGVFATRAPYRPNPIGLTPVRLLSVEGLTLHVAELDLLDGTPVLDIKPYVPWADAIPEAGSGWLERDQSRPLDPGPRFAVHCEPLAQEQLAYLRETHDIELLTRMETVLSTGPRPHAYRRIRELPSGDFELGVKDWRARFAIDGQTVRIIELYSGSRREPVPEEHIAFGEAFEGRSEWNWSGPVRSFRKG